MPCLRCPARRRNHHLPPRQYTWAGIVIAAVGVVLKVMVMLDEAGFLPYWIVSGIFG